MEKISLQAPANTHRSRTCTHMTHKHTGTQSKLDWERLGESWDKCFVPHPLYLKFAHKNKNVWGPPGASTTILANQAAGLI